MSDLHCHLFINLALSLFHCRNKKVLSFKSFKFDGLISSFLNEQIRSSPINCHEPWFTLSLPLHSFVSSTARMAYCHRNSGTVKKIEKLKPKPFAMSWLTLLRATQKCAVPGKRLRDMGAEAQLHRRAICWPGTWYVVPRRHTVLQLLQPAHVTYAVSASCAGPSDGAVMQPGCRSCIP